MRTHDDSSADEFFDQQLLDRLQQGDCEAATAIYARYASRLLSLTQKQMAADLCTRLDPEDVVQSVFRTFFRRAALGAYSVPPGDELWKLFLVIALNKIRRLGAHHRAIKRDISKTQLLPAGSSADYGPSADQSLHILQLTIDEMLAESPEHVRAMVKLRIEGLEVAEIAELTSRSKRSVERALQHFRERLAKELSADDFRFPEGAS
jgi:RNA polymerase sigma-70 factor (ECF subfamily)